jgi:hypothetical protein
VARETEGERKDADCRDRLEAYEAVDASLSSPSEFSSSAVVAPFTPLRRLPLFLCDARGVLSESMFASSSPKPGGSRTVLDPSSESWSGLVVDIDGTTISSGASRRSLVEELAVDEASLFSKGREETDAMSLNSLWSESS